MHEVAIVRGIVETAQAAAEQHNAERIIGISVVIGDLANISDEVFHFNFDVLSRGTKAEDANVTIRREPGRVNCMTCGATGEAGSEPLCPACGSPRVKISGNDQCYLESIDVDDRADS